ncbi:MAG: hypothetical protein R3C10_28300 [Pirellulales bacterium]
MAVVAASGALGGLAHLTRADGVLFVLMALILVGIRSLRLRSEKSAQKNRGMLLKLTAVLFAAYLLVMLPWFIRNLNADGPSPLPSGGVNTAFFCGAIMSFLPIRLIGQQEIFLNGA